MRPSGYGRAVSIVFLLLFSLIAGATARMRNGNLMVADFEGGKVETVSGLALPAIADEQLGGTSEARLTLSRPGAQASRGALRISFRMADGFATPFSSVWALLGAEGLAIDLSAYRGVRFYARSEGGAFLASIGQYPGRSTRATAPFEVKPAWALVEIPFDKFGPLPPPPAGQAPAFVAKDVFMIGFSVASHLRGQFDLELDQLEVYK
jgi:hypothetical protein